MSWKNLINKVNQMDALDLLKQIPDKSIDLVLTDPPYGIGASNKNFKSGTLKTIRDDSFYGKWDDNIPIKEIFKEMFRVSKEQIIFGGNYFIEYLKNTRCVIFWDKNTANTSYADGELAWTSFDKNTKIYRISWVGANAKDDGIRQHPTQKSLELFKRILQDFSEEGQTILDPFMGSWTTAVACQNLKRNFIGCELDKDYCEIGEQRIRQMTLL